VILQPAKIIISFALKEKKTIVQGALKKKNISAYIQGDNKILMIFCFIYQKIYIYIPSFDFFSRIFKYLINMR